MVVAVIPVVPVAPVVVAALLVLPVVSVEVLLARGPTWHVLVKYLVTSVVVVVSQAFVAAGPALAVAALPVVGIEVHVAELVLEGVLVVLEAGFLVGVPPLLVPPAYLILLISLF